LTFPEALLGHEAEICESVARAASKIGFNARRFDLELHD